MAQFYSRKPTRLPDYCYSHSGVYFITICTKDKKCMLGNVSAPTNEAELPQIHLSPVGHLVDAEIRRQDRCYSHISIVKYIVMPNHVHLLLYLQDGKAEEIAAGRANEAIPKYISTLKRFTNKAVGYDLWQRSYHDHIIRSEREYLKIWQYIDANAAKWKLDCYYCSTV